MDTEIRIEDFDKFRKLLRELDRDFGKELARINQDAAKPIAADAADRAARNRNFGSKAAKAIRAARKQKAAVIAGGGKTYPWFWGAEFGAKRWHQFRPWTGNQWTADGGRDGVGYALHPAIRGAVKDGSFIETYGDALTELARKAFPD